MKVKYVDSLKGICCIIVFVGHMTSVFLPYVYFGTNYSMHVPIEKYLFETPLNFFFNAPSALMCFLLLSGFLLPLSTFDHDGKVAVVSKWWGRYTRLMPMALIGCALGWLIMKFGLVYPYRITDLTYSSNYSEWFNAFAPGKILASDGPIYEGVINTFLVSSRYNAPLGTLRWIWQNSFWLLCLNKFCQRWRYRYCLYISLFVLSYIAGTHVYEYFYFGIMLLGMMICDIYYNPFNTMNVKRHPYWGICAFVIGFIFLSVPKGYPESGIYYVFGYTHVTRYMFWALGWGLIVIAAENCAIIKKVLEMPAFLFLGDISFAIYAIHWPVIISITCYVVIQLYENDIMYIHSVLIAAMLSIVIVIVFASVVMRKIYKPILKLEKGIINRLENE